MATNPDFATHHGEAWSHLYTLNEYGGALEAHSITHGAAGSSLTIATVIGTSESGAPVDVYANANGAGVSNSGIVGEGVRSHASSKVYQSLAPVTSSSAATSIASSFNAYLMNADSEHVLSPVGVTRRTRAEIQMSGTVQGPVSLLGPFTGMAAPLSDVSMSVMSSTEANRAAPQVDSAALDPRSGSAFVHAAVSQSGVDAWLAGNPHAQTALAGGTEVLALGSVAMKGDPRADLQYRGSLSVEFEPSDGLDHGFRLALLDPTSVGSFDALHLVLQRDQLNVFELTITDLADLDDTVIPFGQVFRSGYLATIDIEFEVKLLDGASSELAFDVAFSSTVPEPGPALLAALALAVCLSRRRA